MPRRDERRERREERRDDRNDDYDDYSPKKGGRKNNNYDDDYEQYSPKKSNKKVDNEIKKELSSVEKIPPKSRVEVHQPTTEVWDYENHWQKDFIDCCDDCKMWSCAFFCTPCFMGKLFMRTGECCAMFCMPGGLMALRTKLRTGFRIKGSIFKDCLATSFCPLCAAIQLTQELNKQEL